MQKILIIDDEPRIADALSRFLKTSGFEVIIASGGEEGITILHSEVTIDLVVLDMKMPQVSGFNVLKEIQNLKKGTPVIILTGSLDTERYLGELRSMGYDRKDIIYKPADLFAFLDMVKNRLKL